MLQPPVIRIDGLSNIRDLGGLPRSCGGVTPSGVFLRSDSVDPVSEEGWLILQGLGVRTVVDLRQDAERGPHTSGRPAWLRTLHVDHDGLENEAFWADRWNDGRSGTALYYLPHLSAMPERTVAVLHALATARPGGVLFHCAAGRDRTGLIAAILLAAADVEPEAIVTDYLLSTRSPHRAAAESKIEAVCCSFGTTTEGAFRAALAGLDIKALLDALPHEARAAVTTWRGALTAP